MSIKTFLLSFLFFAPFSMLAMKQENNNVASLKELCTQKVLRERLNYGALADSLQDKISERKKQLNDELKIELKKSGDYFPKTMKTVELLEKGANIHENEWKNMIDLMQFRFLFLMRPPYYASKTDIERAKSIFQSVSEKTSPWKNNPHRLSSMSSRKVHSKN